MVGVENDEKGLVSESGQKDRQCGHFTAISFNQVLFSQLFSSCRIIS